MPDAGHRPSAPRFYRLSPLVIGLSYCALTLGGAQALTVPMTGWSAKDSSHSTWADSAGACVLKEESLPQPYPSFSTAEAARAFALKVQGALLGQNEGGQKLQAVITQPVDRAGKWTVMASYLFTSQEVQYRATQLYLSDQGKLRTVTGSSADGEASRCVGQMREFLRYLAD